MIDLRPVGYVIGLLIAALGVTMLVPMLVDFSVGNGHAGAFLESAILTTMIGGLISLACANAVTGKLKIQQVFLMASGVWAVLPVFGAIPFVEGATDASITDAYFEAMSGLTTTGSTVFVGLDDLPAGLLLWRSMLQWFGGIGIIVVAMAFLPELRVGGMQIFRSEAFDTAGKVLPRAAEIASRISIVYLGLTIICIVTYLVSGFSLFNAVNHALTTISTGGFSTHDASFGEYQGAPEYVASVFMVLASLPFVRYVQLLAGSAQPLWRDSQVRVFLVVTVVLIVTVALFRLIVNDDNFFHALREATFNVTSIITGTGYASVDYQLWGAFPVALFFFIGLIGGCAGSTCCSVKIFRYQIVVIAIANQIRRIRLPAEIRRPHPDRRRDLFGDGLPDHVHRLARHSRGAALGDGARFRHGGLGRGDGDRERGSGAGRYHRARRQLLHAERPRQVDPDRRHAGRAPGTDGGFRPVHLALLEDLRCDRWEWNWHSC